MTENSAEQKTPAENELLDDIERRQDEVLAGLDTLNTQLEQVLKLHSASEEQTVADATNDEGNGAQQSITKQPATEEPTLAEAAGKTTPKDSNEETTTEKISAEAPAAMPAIEPPGKAPIEHAGPLMIVPVPEIPVLEIPAPANGATPSEC